MGIIYNDLVQVNNLQMKRNIEYVSHKNYNFLNKQRTNTYDNI